MKIARFILVVAVLGGLGGPLRAEVRMADAVEAVVSDTVITYGQVYVFTKPVLDTLYAQYAGKPDEFKKASDAAFDDSLEQLVQRQLILHSFETEGYKLPDGVIDDVMQERIREQFDGDRVVMVKTLQARGLTVEQYRKQVRDQYIEAAMRRQNVAREIIISPFKVETYYQAHPAEFQLPDQVKLRMITLNKSGDNDTNTLRRADEILARLQKGDSFHDLALLYSQDAQRAAGGERDWIDRTTLNKDLTAAAFALKPGETSGVIDLPGACYLLNVMEARPAHVKPLAEVRDSIEKELLAAEQARLEKQWIESLRRKTFIAYF